MKSSCVQTMVQDNPSYIKIYNTLKEVLQANLQLDIKHLRLPTQR